MLCVFNAFILFPGAEIKKIFALQRRADAKLVDVDVSMVEENKKEFANIASAAATAAMELADALRAKADETTMPLKKEALLDFAEALELQAKDVMDRANELLRLPGDKPRQQKLQDALNKLKKTMKDALIPLQEDYVAACNPQKWTFEGGNAQQVQRMTTDPADKKRAFEQLLEAIKAGDKPKTREALDRVEWELDNVQALAKRIMGVRPEAHEPLEQFNLKRRGLRAEVKEAEKGNTKKLEGFWADLMDCQAKLMDEIMPFEDRVMQLAQEQLADMDRIKRALRKGDDGSTVTITKNVFGTHKELMKAAEKCHNGWKKGRPKKMRECVTGANGVMGGYVKGVQSAVKDPNTRGKAYNDSQDLALAVEDVCAEALPIEEAVILAGEAQIKDLRAQHDPNRAGWTELQDTIEQRGPRLERLAREAKDAKDADNERRKLKIGKGRIPDDADVEAELRKLRSVAEQQKEQARSDGPDWLRTNLRHVEAVQDAVASALTPKSRLVYLANKALEDLKLGSDPDRFTRGPGQALSHHVERVVEEANKVANSFNDPTSRDRLKKLAEQMEPLLEELHGAAAKANRSGPNSDPAREFVKLNHRLGDLTRQLIREAVLPTGEIQALADRVIKGLDNQLNNIPRGDQGAVTGQNADLEDAADQLAELADFAAKHAGDDYAAKHRIRGAGEVLRRDQPVHAAASLRAVASPKDAEPMRDVKGADRRLRSAVEALVGDTATPEAQLAAIARQLVQHIDDLTEGVRDGGDDMDVPTLATVEGALAKKLGLQADKIRGQMVDDALAKQLAQAMEDVNDLLPYHLSAVNDVVRDPNKPEGQQALTTDAQALKDAVLAVVAAAQASPEEELRPRRKLARDALLDGQSKATKADPEAAPAEARGTEGAKQYREAERCAREIAVRMPDGRGVPVEQAAFDVRAASENAPEALKNAATDGSPESAVVAAETLSAADSAAERAERDGAARLKGEARKMQRGLHGVMAGLQKGDPQHVAARIRDTADRFAEVAQLAEAEAKSRGPGADQDAILDVVALLKDGIPQLSDAAVEAMNSKWDPATTDEAVRLAQKLEGLAGSLADGSWKEELSKNQNKIPEDDRRGKRLWNVMSPDFVGRDELQAAAALEALIPELTKASASGGAALEAALAKAEKEAGRLGRAEPSANARVAQLARLADADVQHYANEVNDGRDVSKLTPVLEDASQNIPRSVKPCIATLPTEQQEHINAASRAVGSNLPGVVAGAKSRDRAQMAGAAESTHAALEAVADALDPSAELTLLELRDQAGDALEGLQQKGPSKYAEYGGKLANLRAPTLRALGEALRRANAGTDAAADAEELSRLWAGLPQLTRSGDQQAVSAQAARIDGLLDKLLQSTRAFPCGLAKRIDLDLYRLQSVARSGDQQAASALATGIISDLKDLVNAAEGAADTMKDKAAAQKLRDAVQAAKTAAAGVIKRMPEFLADPKNGADLDGAAAQVRAQLASAVAAAWPDDQSKLYENVRHIEAALANARNPDETDDALSEALKRVPRLGQGPAVDALRVAVQKAQGKDGAELEAALQHARRRLWIAAREAPDADADPDGLLEKARAQFAAEGIRARKGTPRAGDGLVSAAKKLIAGTRANYKRQGMETFDLSKLDAAAAKAQKRPQKSLADVLADLRKARQQRERDRQAALAAEAAAAAARKGGDKGAFGAMQDDIDTNLKKMVVGSPLDFENERCIQLIRQIASDFALVGQKVRESGNGGKDSGLTRFFRFFFFSFFFPGF